MGTQATAAPGGENLPKDLSVNFVPVPYPEYPRAVISVRPSERQLWRVLNASSVTYLNLTALYKRGSRFQPVDRRGGDRRRTPVGERQAGSRDFVARRHRGFTGIARRVHSHGATGRRARHAGDAHGQYRAGPRGENDPNRALVSIIATAEAAAPRSSLPESTVPPSAQSLPWLGDVTPVRVRKLFFTEDPADSKNPGAATFYLTVDGRETPAAFDPKSTEPNIVVKQGDVEDWVIENRTNELHAFHIHQIHFQVRDWAGLTVNEAYLRDTVNVPFFDSTVKPIRA